MSQKTACSCPHSSHAVSATPVPPRQPMLHAAHQLMLRIHNMDCPTEEKLIRQSLEALPGITDLSFDLLNRILTIHHELPDSAIIFEKLKVLGMSGEPVDPARAVSDQSMAQAPATSGKQILLMGFATSAAFASEILAWANQDDTSWMVITLALLAILAGGIPTIRKGWIALRHFSLNMHLLMSSAVIGAVALGQWPEAAVVICLFAIAEMIEARSLERARDEIAGLVVHAPDHASVLQDDQEWQETPVSEIQVGQILRARAGECIALDGVVLSGQSSVDQAAITGESMPQEKSAGDLVYAGTLNQSGNLQIRVTSVKSDTMLARIARTVQQAHSQRAPTQSLVDQFASRYTPAVFVCALLIAVLPPLIGNSSWQASIYQALVLLVIACPCALVISTPVAIVSALALAAKRGILVKGGLYLEQGRKLSVIALDKTGTITHGKPELTDIIALEQLDQPELLRLAASLEAGSQHPVARALQKAYSGALAQVEKFQALPGRGVRAEIQQKTYYLGNLRLLGELTSELNATPALSLSDTEKSALLTRMEQLEAQCKTVVLLCDTHQVLGLFAVADTLRAESSTAISQLRAMGIQLVMLTGDNAKTAQVIAQKTGITDVRSELLPDEKLAAIAQLSLQGTVGMVGDGVNDAPALARAHIGFAMGAAGSDTALETADVALMQDDLRKLPEFIRISQRTRSVLWQNIGFALGVKALFFALTLSGYSSMWMAVFADAGTSLLVVLNSLRLLRYKT